MDLKSKLLNIKKSIFKDIIYYLDDIEDDDWYAFSNNGLFGFGLIGTFCEIRVYCSERTFEKVIKWITERYKTYGKLNNSNCED